MTDYYVGLDISQKSTAICVIDENGKPICEGVAVSRPADIFNWLKNRIDIERPFRVGLEAGTLSTWLYRGLTKRGLDLTVMETFQAHRFLATMRNKTDKNDARGLAQLLRMGGEDFLRVVRIRSQASQETRTLLSVRWHLLVQKTRLENHIAGIIKPYGAIVRRGKISPEDFRRNIITAANDVESQGVDLIPIIMPILDLYRLTCAKIDPINEKIEAIAKSIPMVSKFMEIPGVGPITALSFYSAVDYPERFKKSTDVAAYFGLTPKQIQSGATDYTIGISKRGDPSVRRALVTAATVLLTNTKHWCSLKAWGVRLVKRIGISKARVAVARKLAVIMHKIWLNDDKWRPKTINNSEWRKLANVKITPALESIL